MDAAIIKISYIINNKFKIKSFSLFTVATARTIYLREYAAFAAFAPVPVHAVDGVHGPDVPILTGLDQWQACTARRSGADQWPQSGAIGSVRAAGGNQ